jgi:hypothetical protein
LLLGNPYPSALDADKFIDDNIGTIETSTTDPGIDGSCISGNITYQHTLLGVNKVRESITTGGVKPSSIGVDWLAQGRAQIIS